MGINASGYVALGYSETPGLVTPGSLSDVVNTCTQNIVGSAWNPLVFSFKPIGREDDYFVNNTSADINHRSYGFVRLYSSNGAGTNVNSFVVDVDFDMEVW